MSNTLQRMKMIVHDYATNFHWPNISILYINSYNYIEQFVSVLNLVVKLVA
jgi:hypothetical protein